MKRTRLKPRSPKMKLIMECEALLRKVLLNQRGDNCQICRRKTGHLGLFHVLDKNKWPRLRLHPDNILLAGWFCCHKRWHHEPHFARDTLFPRLKELLGEDYETLLKVKHARLPKMNMTTINATKMLLEIEVENI